MAKKGELSPMMQQYFQIKKDYPGVLLFFRLGDFYEMFFDDAKTASEELDLVLTGRDCGLSERAPMCGVPYHSCEAYIARLVQKGYKVAICEQTEDPATAKGIVKREIVRIITPGTAVEDSLLDESKYNFLSAIVFSKDGFGISFADMSTGKAMVTEISGGDSEERVIDEINRFSPSEVVVSRDIELYPTLHAYLKDAEIMITVRDKNFFATEDNEELIKRHFNVISPENMGIPSMSNAVAALGSALRYFYEIATNRTISITTAEYYSANEFMHLDHTAVRNLELCETMRT